MPQLSRADLKLKLIQAISKNGRNLNTGLGIQKFIDVLVDSVVNTVDDGFTVGGTNADWLATTGAAQILNKPSTFTPSAHTHSIANISLLQDALDQKGELGGVPIAGDTLNKLYNLIVAQFSEVTVADIAARDAYDVTHLPTNIFVTNDGDGNWALYKATTIGVGANFVKLSDPDLLNALQTASQIKAAYESNADTNAFTNALKAFLDAVPTNTIKGRLTAGVGSVEDLTGTQITTLLDVFTSTLKGLVPASGGGTTKYLRADGSFELLETEKQLKTISSDFTLGTNADAVFNLSAIGGGQFNFPVARELGKFGVRTITSAAAANSGYLVQHLPLLGGVGETFYAVFKTPASFTATVARIGFHSSTTIADAVNGSGYLEINAGVVSFKTAINSVRTTVLSITLTASTWYKVLIERTGIAETTFKIYNDLNVLLATQVIPTNVPVLIANEYRAVFSAHKTTTGVTSLYEIDYMLLSREKPNALNF